MHCHIIAVAQKLPSWCQQAKNEYQKRLQRYVKCDWTTIPVEKRHKGNTIEHCKEEEATKILKQIKPQSSVIMLDASGQSWSTEELAEQLACYQRTGQKVNFVIGGPDGLTQQCLSQSDHIWSLSKLIFPHHLVQVILLEQLYRATSLLQNHPYHRA